MGVTKHPERLLVVLVRGGEWEVDADGAIWRTCVRIGRGRHGAGSRLVPCARRRVEKRQPDGYCLVRAMVDGVRVTGLAHRLVWQAAFGDIPDGKPLNHINGIKDDNRPSNLEVVTYSENTKHAYRIGLRDEHGQGNPACRLTDNQVAQIRASYASGAFTQQQIAERFGVRHQHVSRIVRGQRRPKQGGQIHRHDLRRSTGERDATTGRFIGKPTDLRVQQFPEVRR